MDPINIIETIYAAGMTVREAVKDVKANPKQCQRLAERVDAIISVLQSMKDTDLQRAELEQSLQNFRTCVEQCCKFVKQFEGKSWFSKVFKNQTYKEEFQELNQQLSQCAVDLNLGINLKQVFDPNQDESDEQKDLSDIQAKLDEIALMMVKQQEEQFNHYKSIKIHVNERFNSLKHNLELNIVRLNDPVSAKKIAQEENAFLHIPYYDLLQEQHIGRGAFSDVYRGRWLSHDHEVAIKIIRIHNLGEEFKGELIKEISTMHKIRYDHILNIFGACMEPKTYALVVEYMSLGSLYDVLKQQTIKLTWPDRWSIAFQMTKGVNYLHRLPKPIIHRDIKSLNILMSERVQGFLVKIGDFGFAKIRNETARQSSQPSLIGTLAWQAPEILQMKKHTDASDVYSLGIVLWELATGLEPYEGSNNAAIREFVNAGDRMKIPTNVPSSFTKLISSAWAQEPQQRPTCQQLLSLMKENVSESNKSKEADEPVNTARIGETASTTDQSPPESGPRLSEPSDQTGTTAMTKMPIKFDYNQFTDDLEVLASLPFRICINPMNNNRTHAIMDSTNHNIHTLSILTESYVPFNIFCFKNLHTLTINGTPFNYGNADYDTDVMPDGFGNLKLLTTLNILNTKISQMTEEIGKLERLTTLNIQNTPINKIADQLGKLEQLTTLNIQNSPINKMSDQLGNLVGLVSLTLVNCSLSSLPNLSKLTRLTTLTLSSNPLTSLIGLQKVNTLTLNNCQFTNIPAVANPMTLTILSMENNRLSQVNNLGLYKSLRSVNFNGNTIDQLLPSIAQVPGLTTLILSNNKLWFLPNEILGLPYLQIINIANNTFSPAELLLIKNMFKTQRAKVNLIA